jgi:hypothetical protein
VVAFNQFKPLVVSGNWVLASALMSRSEALFIPIINIDQYEPNLDFFCGFNRLSSFYPL